jgi:hypothetical protein
MKKKFTIAVVDGKGGGIGKTLVERIKEENLDAEILALGTNSAATSNMMKSGADQGAIGESQALKVLIPLEKCNVALTNSNNLSLKDNIDNAAKIIKEYIEKTEK